MKKFFSTLLAASLMLIGTQAFAQMSVNAGYLNSSLSDSNANGAYAGISFNLPIAGGLAVAPGVYYSMITSKDGVEIENIYKKTGTFMEHAVNVPVYLNYGFGISRDTKFVLYGGPTLQYGLASTVKNNRNAGGKIEINTETDNFKDPDFNRFNVYLGGGLGFQAGAILVTVGYDYGMMPQYKEGKTHRKNLKLGVGFAF